MKFDRVYHPYHLWEEVAAGMWSASVNKKEQLERAASFTGDHKAYGENMLRVVSEWPISCENALTDESLNQRAWVGHAACALAIGCPEDITREAWGLLSDEQRILANREADRAIRVWRNNYAKSRGLRSSLDQPLLL
jgi:hypothetical protein